MNEHEDTPGDGRWITRVGETFPSPPSSRLEAAPYRPAYVGPDRRKYDRSKFGIRLKGWPPRRIIPSCAASRGPLLTRYYLTENRWFAVYVHHLHVSDDERALHDHPWSFVTCLLTSGYFEYTPGPQRGGLSKTWRRRFSVLYRPAEWAHRLELVRPAWTLVLRWRRRRLWGFFTRQGWQEASAYGRTWCD